MKKLILLLCTMHLALCTVFSQPFNVQSAHNYLKNGRLEKAKAAIDQACLDAKTSTWPKTWYLKGSIYHDIYFSKDKTIKDLDSNALKIAFESYVKAVELDDKKEEFNEYNNKILSCNAEYYYYKGIAAFNAGNKSHDKKDYRDAMNYFEKTITSSTALGVKDTNSMFNAALSAEKGGKPENAKSYYISLIKEQPKKLANYVNLQKVYKELKDTAKALETIQNAETIFPNNLVLIIEETNIYLAKGESEKAQQNLLKAIEKDPNNANLYYAIGSNYDKIYYDTTRTMNERMKAYDEAERSYKKAIDLKPDFFDANYNLGALYFNESVRIKDAADKIQDQKLYDAENAKVEAMWQKALPYLEKAHTLEPKDRNTLISLKQIYARTKQYDKAKDMNQQLEQLKK